MINEGTDKAAKKHFAIASINQGKLRPIRHNYLCLS